MRNPASNFPQNSLRGEYPNYISLFSRNNNHKLRQSTSTATIHLNIDFFFCRKHTNSTLFALLVRINRYIYIHVDNLVYFPVGWSQCELSAVKLNVIRRRVNNAMPHEFHRKHNSCPPRWKISRLWHELCSREHVGVWNLTKITMCLWNHENADISCFNCHNSVDTLGCTIRIYFHIYIEAASWELRIQIPIPAEYRGPEV